MITQKTSQKTIENKFGQGWKYTLELTGSQCEVYEKPIKGNINPERLYCFYDGERKGEITNKPWEEK